MREQIIHALGGMLQNNLGQRLTPELATGIATNLNQLLTQLLPAEPEQPPINQESS